MVIFVLGVLLSEKRRGCNLLRNADVLGASSCC